jgi:hypothetical protein
LNTSFQGLGNQGKKRSPPPPKPQNNIIILPYFHSTSAINIFFWGEELIKKNPKNQIEIVLKSS